MPRIFSMRLSIGALAALLALPAAPVHASYTITCNSHGYRYQYCSANTNGHVRLQYQTSQAPCVRGRSWGSDSGGVWVNNGCSAQFEVGGDPGGGGSAAGAAAAIAGLAILGAIIANHDREQDGNGYGPPPNYPVGGGPVPGWAVGTFNGTLWGQRQTIQIGPDGGVNVWYRRGGSAAGWFSGNTMTIGNNAMNVQPSGGGILVNGAYFGR